MTGLSLDPVKALRSVIKVLQSLLIDHNHNDQDISPDFHSDDLELNDRELQLKLAVSGLVTAHLAVWSPTAPDVEKAAGKLHFAAEKVKALSPERYSEERDGEHLSEEFDSDLHSSDDGAGDDYDPDDADTDVHIRQPKVTSKSAGQPPMSDDDWLAYKRRAVEFWLGLETRPRTFKCVCSRFRRLKSKQQLFEWKRQVNAGGSNQYKLGLIDRKTWERYQEFTAHSTETVTRDLIKSWACDFSRQLGVENFSARSGWLSRWKSKHDVGVDEKETKTLMNDAVLIKYQAFIKLGKTVHDRDIKEWALQANQELGLKDFRAGDGWIQYFKEKNHIAFRKEKRVFGKRKRPVDVGSQEGEVTPS